MDKHRINDTTQYDSSGILVSWNQRSWWILNGVTPNRGAKYRWGRLESAIFLLCSYGTLTIASVVNLVESQVYHTEHPLLHHARSSVTAETCYYCMDTYSSTFAACSAASSCSAQVPPRSLSVAILSRSCLQQFTGYCPTYWKNSTFTKAMLMTQALYKCFLYPVLL